MFVNIFSTSNKVIKNCDASSTDVISLANEFELSVVNSLQVNGFKIDIYHGYMSRLKTVEMIRILKKQLITQPTTSDHINIKYIWGPHVNHMGTPR